MRRYRLFEKRVTDVPVMMYLSVIMDDEEDLTIGDDEKAAGMLLRWLNERGAAYHIEVNYYEPTREKDNDKDGGLYRAMFYHHEYEIIQARRREHFDLLIYDDATAALMSLFHESFVEIIPPEVIAAREAEAKRLEAKAAEVAAQREKEDAENARRIAKGKTPIVSAIEIVEGAETVVHVDEVAPPTRAWLQRVFGGRHRQRENPL